MKTLFILAALFAAFGIVGEIDYQAATGLDSEHGAPLSLVVSPFNEE